MNLTGQSGKAWDAISNPYGIPSFGADYLMLQYFESVRTLLNPTNSHLFYCICFVADVLECTEVLDCDGSAALVECLFDAGHECNFDYMVGSLPLLRAALFCCT